jgi:hypothetical protein
VARHATSSGPFINVAGYMGSEVYAETGGTLTILAWATSAPGDPIQSVELAYGGRGLGVMLPHMGGGVYQLDIPFGPGEATPLTAVIELIAHSAGGDSAIWPHLTVFAQ